MFVFSTASRDSCYNSLVIIIPLIRHRIQVSGVWCTMFSLSARVGGDLISYEFIFVLTACLNLSLSYLPPLPKCDLLTATLQTCAWCFEEWRYLLQKEAGSDSGKGWVQIHCRVCAQRGVEVALSNQTAPSDEINFRGCDQVCKCVVQVSVCLTAPFFSSEKKLRLQGTNCSNDEIFFHLWFYF